MLGSPSMLPSIKHSGSPRPMSMRSVLAPLFLVLGIVFASAGCALIYSRVPPFIPSSPTRDIALETQTQLQHLATQMEQLKGLVSCQAHREKTNDEGHRGMHRHPGHLPSQPAAERTLQLTPVKRVANPSPTEFNKLCASERLAS